jgi:hypothetical protein
MKGYFYKINHFETKGKCGEPGACYRAGDIIRIIAIDLKGIAGY